MAYVCKEEFGGRNKAGAGIRFDTRLYAVASGDFLFYDVPPEILQFINRKYQFEKQGRLAVRTRTKDAGMGIIKKAIDKYLVMRVEEVLVIRYSFTTTCHYYVSGEGAIYQSGQVFEDATDGDYHNDSGSWNIPIIAGEEDSDYSGEYMIGFAADVRKKKTYISSNYRRVEYDCPGEDTLGFWGQKLNKFVRVRFRGKPIELPYSEKTAQFFYQSMWRLCELAERLNDFLGDPKNVLEATEKLLPELENDT